MKLNLFIISTFIFLNNFYSFSQTKKYVKLFDSYNNERIIIDSTFKLTNRKFKIINSNNLIEINFSLKKKLIIEANNYDTYSYKVKFNGKDTIAIQLTPNETTINKRYSEIWTIENKIIDTLTFETLKSLQDFTSSYLNYLSALKNKCDNGMCDFSNSYSYKIYFSNNDSIFYLEKIEPKKNYEIQCAELDEKMILLKEIFPKFRLKEKTDNFYIQYFITLR